MNLCIDRGNTRTKVAIFDGSLLVADRVYDIFTTTELEEVLHEFKIGASILSDVKVADEALGKYLQQYTEHYIYLDHTVKLPVENLYETPETLGKDRIAAVVGAVTLKPDSDILVVDAGTAITYDFVDAKGVYHGGNIAPGIEMRLKALHVFTGRLPMVSVNEIKQFPGKNTTDAMLSGSIYGALFEIEGYFEALRIKYPELSIFLTGGDIKYFVSKLKSPIFAEKNLVLTGLNRILQFNVKK